MDHNKLQDWRLLMVIQHAHRNIMNDLILINHNNSTIQIHTFIRYKLKLFNLNGLLYLFNLNGEPRKCSIRCTKNLTKLFEATACDTYPSTSFYVDYDIYFEILRFKNSSNYQHVANYAIMMCCCRPIQKLSLDESIRGPTFS